MSQSVLVCLNCGRSYDFRQLDAAIRLPLRDGKSEVFSELMDHVLSGLGLGLVCKGCFEETGSSWWLWCSEVVHHDVAASLRKIRDDLTSERDRARETSAQSPPADSAPHRLIGGASLCSVSNSKP